jgi:hypothetical protein
LYRHRVLLRRSARYRRVYVSDIELAEDETFTFPIADADPDGTRFFWQLVKAPAGLTLAAEEGIVSADDGYHAYATLNWTPTVRDLADTEIVVRVQDSRGGTALKHFHLPVAGGNHAPVVDGGYDIILAEGETLTLPIELPPKFRLPGVSR